MGERPTPAALDAQRVLSELPRGVCVARATDGEVEFVNSEWRRMLGSTRYLAPSAEEVGGELVRADGTAYPLAELPFELVRESRSDVELDDIYVAQNGQPLRRVRLHGRPVFGNDRSLTHVVIVAEGCAAQDLEKDIVQVINQVTPVSLVVSRQRDAVVLYNNRAAQEFAGGDMVGRSVLPLYQDPDERQALLEEIRATGRVDARRLRLKTMLGKPVVASVSLRPLSLDGEECWLGTLMDVTALHETEQELRRSIHEKDVLFRELCHRVKNNLQLVSSLLDLHGTAATHHEVKSALRASQGRISTMAMVYDLLQQDQEISRIRFDQFLEQLVSVSQLRVSGVQLRLQTVPVELTIGVAIPCGLVSNELIANAQRHGCQLRGGVVCIELGCLNGHMEMSIADDGIGMPSGRQSWGLGMKLVEALVAQVHGTLQTSNGPNGGTIHRVVVPVAAGVGP